MLTSREKSYAAAQRFQQKGQLDKAIAELERLVQEDPADVRTLLKIGDLHVRRQDNPAAVVTYTQVARTFQTQGFSLKAVAVYKQVVHLEPTNTSAVTELATLYEQLSLVSDAVAQLHHLLGVHKAAGAWGDATGVLRKLMALSGETQDLLLQWAEVHTEMGDTAEVKRTLNRVAEACLAQGRLDDWAQVGEDLLQVDPELGGLACELARHYMSKEQPKQALIKLQVAFRAAPQDTETLTLLAQVFEALGQTPKAIAVLHELGSQAQQRGQTLALERIAGHILKLDGEDRQAQAWMAPPGMAKAAARQQQRAAPPPAPGPWAGHTSLQGAAAAPPPEKVDLTNLLIEASVFARYGLVARANEYLGRVLAAFPEHQGARTLQDELRGQQAAHDAQVPRALQTPNDATMPTAAHSPSDNQAQIEAPVQSPPPRGFAFDGPASPAPMVEGPATDSAMEPLLAEEGHAVEAAQPPEQSAEEPVFLLDLGDADNVLEGLLPEQGKAINLDELIAEEVPHDGDAPRAATRLDKHFDTFLMHAQGGDAIAPLTQVVDASDHDTQYNLGIAYKEMGLFDDALNQFSRLQDVPQYTVSARSMAALCLQDSGRHKEAQALLRIAVALPEATALEQAALYYDLATSLLGSGDEEGAREAFTQAAALDAGFRDVAARLQHPHLAFAEP